jgi:hypothetical protein
VIMLFIYRNIVVVSSVLEKHQNKGYKSFFNILVCEKLIFVLLYKELIA